MKYKIILKIFFMTIITFVLLAILLSQIQVSDVMNTLVRIDFVYLVAGFILYLCSYVFRALRFNILLCQEIGIRELFNIVCVHNMVNSILPARTGELSYVYLLKKKHNRKTGEGIATLFVARLFDFIALLILFLISAFMLQDLPEITIRIVWVTSSILCLIIIALIIALFGFDEKFLNKITIILEISNLKKYSFVHYLLKKWTEAVECFEKIRSFEMITIIKLIIISTGIWLSGYFSAYVLVIGMNIQLNLFHIIFATTFSTFTTILPIQGISGFGTFEGGWTIGFIAVGLTEKAAISSGFVYHIIIISYFLILGLFGLIALYKEKSNWRRRTPLQAAGHDSPHRPVKTIDRK